MSKKIIITAVVIIALAVLGFGIYFVLQQKQSPPSAPGISGTFPQPQPFDNTNSQSVTPSPNQSNASFGVLGDTQASAFFVDTQNNVFIVQPDGEVTELSNGILATLSGSKITNLMFASFAPNGKKVLVGLGTPTLAEYSLFDLTTKTWQLLPEHISKPSWAPQGATLAFFEPKGEVQSLLVVDTTPLKAKVQEVGTLSIEDVEVQWKDKTHLLLLQKGSAETTGSLWSFDILKKTLLPVAQNQLGFQGLWDGVRGDRGVVFSGDPGGKGGSLSLITDRGQITPLSFLTLPSKCTFGATATPLPTTTSTKSTATTTVSSTLFCAIPRDGTKTGQYPLPDAYQKGLLMTADNLYAVATNGTPELLYGDRYTYDATELQVVNQKLFFINRVDKKIYALSLFTP